MRPRKKPINNGLRSIENILIKQNKLDSSVKSEISKEIKPNKKIK